MFKFLCCGTSKKKDKDSEKSEFQLLLLGTDELAKLNIIKSLATLQNQFSHEDRINMIVFIKRHIRDVLTDLLDEFKKFTPPIQLEHPENEWRAIYILTIAQQNDFNYPLEFFEHVAILWADTGVKSCFLKSKPNHWISLTEHFFNRLDEIKEANYIPTDQDMIHARFFKSGVYQMFFDFESIAFRLIEVDLLQRERRKWIHCFSDVNAIVFVADCSNFTSELMEGDNFQSDLIESIEKFQMTRINPSLQKIPVILLLNKQDLLAKKIKDGFTIEAYFREYYGNLPPPEESVELDLDEDQEINRAKNLLQNQFFKIPPRFGAYDYRCYLHFIRDIGMETIRLIFDDCHKIIIQQNLQREFLP